ncbi:hypothetical protein [Flavobacterium sp.]|uniref:hypothetical protein n=1 Tax=Flavobacterium sp. TaxID=239 RepID=UPI0025DEBC68|nr:hypothetical protein [Flavobacterium sp.]
MENTLENNAENDSKFTTYLALGSFSVGTLLFLAYMLNPNSTLIKIGFCYVMFALLVNTIALISLIIDLLLHWENREQIAIKILILLANLPIAFLYLNIIFNHSHI